jgi:hypothetical protein
LSLSKKRFVRWKKTEEDLSKNQISNETLNRQNQIIEKLLEAEKSDQERGKDKKRESKEAKATASSGQGFNGGLSTKENEAGGALKNNTARPEALL